MKNFVKDIPTSDSRLLNLKYEIDPVSGNNVVGYFRVRVFDWDLPKRPDYIKLMSNPPSVNSRNEGEYLAVAALVETDEIWIRYPYSVEQRYPFFPLQVQQGPTSLDTPWIYYLLYEIHHMEKVTIIRNLNLSKGFPVTCLNFFEGPFYSIINS
jgi:hypothetical protein